jgi:hypothetical protein
VGSAKTGNGQEVSDCHMGIREGEPWPTMAMKVGVGSWRREAGEMEEVRVRMYSWQFCRKYQQNIKVVFIRRTNRIAVLPDLGKEKKSE